MAASSGESLAAVVLYRTQSLLHNASVVLCVGLLALCSACGHGGGQLADAASSKSAAPLPQDPHAAGLPSLNSLPAAKHRVSSTTGYLSLSPQDFVSSAGWAPGPGDAVDLGISATESSFVLYGISGFDGDARPLGIRLSTSQSDPDQKYYIAFSDYVKGVWQIQGPFTSRLASSSTEISINYKPGYLSPASYTTPPGPGAAAGTFYFAVICQGPPANSLRIESLEVESFGGIKGPRAGAITNYTAADGHPMLRWSPSPDYHRPDFAGYVVESAPLFDGEFSPVNTVPALDDYLVDTAASGPLRYRMYCVDTAGNRSSYFPQPPDGVLFIDDPRLVALMDLPRGPLHGAQAVKIDMSRSFDASGGTLDTYSLKIDGVHPDVSGPDPVKFVFLQPGCYNIHGMVSEAGNGGVDTVRQLVIYPSWDSSPVQVASGSGPQTRLAWLHGGRNSADGKVYFAGYDGSISALAIYGGPETGPFTYIDSVGTAREVTEIDEPVQSNGKLYFKYSQASGPSGVLGVSSAGISNTPSFGSSALSRLFVDGTGQANYVVAADSGGTWSILLAPFPYLGGAPPSIASGLDAVTSMDAEYNPAQDRVEVLYTTGSGLYFTAYKISAATTVVPPVQLSPAAYGPPDMEFDPVANQMFAISMMGHVQFISWTDAGVLSSAQIDGSGINFSPYDLEITPAGDRYAFFAGGFGQAHLYHFNSGTNSWDIPNTMDYSTDSAYAEALVTPSSGPGMIIGDTANGGLNFFVRSQDGDVEDVLNQLDGTDGAELELQSAASSAGLHALWFNQRTGLIKSTISADGGATWDPPTDAGAAGAGQLARLASAWTIDSGHAAKDAYITYNDGTNFVLAHWGGASWVPDLTHEADTFSQPVLSAQPLGSGIEWMCNDEAANKWFYAAGDYSSFSSGSLEQAGNNNLAFGAINNQSYSFGSPQHFLYLTGGSTGQGLKSVPNSTLAERLIFEPNGLGSTSPEDYLLNPLEMGAALATAPYALGIDGSMANAYWLATDNSFQPLRYEEEPVEQFGSIFQRSANLPGFSVDPASSDLRRSTSAVVANGMTAVAIVSSFDGKECYMEWSNFGDWEKLPLPKGMGKLAHPRLLVDSTGRWFLFGVDIATNNIVCWRSEWPVV